MDWRYFSTAEFDDTSECGDNEAVLECESEFIKDLNSTAEVSEEKACR